MKIVVAAFAVLLIFLRGLGILPRFLLKSFLVAVSLVLTVVLAIACIEVFWVSPRDISYRYVAPEPSDPDNACRRQIERPDLLARYDNSEDKLRRSEKGAAGLECMMQYHTVPSKADAVWFNSDRAVGPIGYHLSFLEYQENGRFAQKGLNGTSLARGQLEVLEEHLGKQSNNYVFIFIHGWRHDARIGDDNVANVRVYAAHAASALDYRCKTTGKDCDYTVTAVFVGWRGARVDERSIEAFIDRRFGFLGAGVGRALKGMAAHFPAALTLFDRKPVSERIAPSVVASIRHVDRMLKKRNAEQSKKEKLVVIGHSLGGNMLATALQPQMIDAIRRHRSGDVMKPPIGNLVVMINPAAEAWKWTSLQREMRTRARFPENVADVDDEALAGRRFFPEDQPPVYVSITSAFSWPASSMTERELLERGGRDPESDEMKAVAKYDAATHDAFPLFKGNLLPLSETMDRLAAWFPKSRRSETVLFPDRSACQSFGRFEETCVSATVQMLRYLAGLLRNVPFTNTASDDTMTIGHVDPPRPPYGKYDGFAWQSPLPFGTTHELIVNNRSGHNTYYTNAGSPYFSECAIVDHWLWSARHNKSIARYEGWDSGYSRVRAGIVVPDADTPNVTPIRPRSLAADGHLEIQFRQFLHKSGTQPIVTGNDPMWNIRAFDTALASHGGYVSYPLICALNQLVMDDVASAPGR